MWAAFYFPLSMIFTTRVQSHTFLTIYETKIELAELSSAPESRCASCKQKCAQPAHMCVSMCNMC